MSATDASAVTSASVGSSVAKHSSPDSSGDDSRGGEQAGAALRVDFYVLEAAAPAARLRLACRLAEKAYLGAQTTLIWHTDPQELGRLDELLWTFMDGSFVPHDLLTGRDAPCTAGTAVLLSAGAAPARTVDLLINLATDIPPCLARCHRIAEIVDGDAARRSAGRVRFKAYRELGVQPVTHSIRPE
ncbi:MAG TPA: DNA polymerase III subunit chi [Steroidobacteraceae bacterium]